MTQWIDEPGSYTVEVRRTAGGYLLATTDGRLPVPSTIAAVLDLYRWEPGTSIDIVAHYRSSGFSESDNTAERVTTTLERVMISQGSGGVVAGDEAGKAVWSWMLVLIRNGVQP